MIICKITEYSEQRARAREIFARKYIFYLTLNRLAGRRRAMNSMEIYARAPPSLSLAETERTRSTYTGASLAGPIWALYDRPIASSSSISITIYKNRRLLGGEEPPIAEHMILAILKTEPKLIGLLRNRSLLRFA
jgi:hypothetical protein